MKVLSLGSDLTCRYTFVIFPRYRIMLTLPIAAPVAVRATDTRRCRYRRPWWPSIAVVSDDISPALIFQSEEIPRQKRTETPALGACTAGVLATSRHCYKVQVGVQSLSSTLMTGRLYFTATRSNDNPTVTTQAPCITASTASCLLRYPQVNLLTLLSCGMALLQRRSLRRLVLSSHRRLTCSCSL